MASIQILADATPPGPMACAGDSCISECRHIVSGSGLRQGTYSLAVDLLDTGLLEHRLPWRQTPCADLTG